MTAIRAIERDRLAAQRRRLQGWVVVDEQRLARDPGDAALQFVVEQGRRNLARLEAAIAGRTPSAVVGRPEPADEDRMKARDDLARGETAHAADNALTFLDRPGAGNRTRAARWLLRLDLERLDAPDIGEGDRDGLRWALEVLRANPEAETGPPRTVRDAVIDLLARLRG